MKYSLTIQSIIVILLCSQLTACAVPPTSATVAKTVVEAWKLKKFDEIERYVAALSKRYPKRICSVLSGVFVDLTLHGDVDKARQKLELVGTGILGTNIAVSDEFRRVFTKQSMMLSLYDAVLAEQGATKEDLKRNPEVAKVREFYGNKVPELLELVGLAPDADLP